MIDDRQIVVLLVLLGTLGGCAGVPPAVIWTTVGAGLGAGAAALTFDTEALRMWETQHPEPPVERP